MADVAHTTDIAEMLGELRAELAELCEWVEAQQREIAEVRSQVARAGATIWAYDDVLRFLGVSKRKAEELVSKKRIPHFHIGSLVRFHRRAVEEWAKRGCRKPGTPRFHSAARAPGGE